MEHAHASAVLPQWYADQFGWDEIVAETALACDQLTPDRASDKNCGESSPRIMASSRDRASW